MTLETVVTSYADKGFAYAVAIYLLYRYHTIDREYLKVLTELSTSLKEHMRQKDEALEMLKDAQKK